MSTGGIVAAIGAIALGMASLIGWGSTSSTTQRPGNSGHRPRRRGLVPCEGLRLLPRRTRYPVAHRRLPGPERRRVVRQLAGSGMSAQDYVAESIEQPGAFISPAFRGGVGPTTFMPQLDVSDAEVDALVAYLLRT